MTRPAADLKGRRVLVVGLARTGLAAAQFLARHGAIVTVNDRRTADELAAERAAVEAIGARFVPGGHPEELFRAAEMIVVSPGVPLAMPVFESARAAGVEILSEIELAARYLEGTIVAVTGSNGKSTTTSLIGEMLRAGGLPARTCGNIGIPFIAMADGDGPDAFYALEVSSFQLEAVRAFRPKVAVLTHVTPDHMDRYAGYADYVAAKARLFEAQDSTDHAVLNALDRDSQALRPRIRARVHQFSSGGPLADGGYLEAGQLVIAEGGRAQRLMPEADLPIPGRHNVENVLAAALACRALGVPIEAIRSAALSFRALPHRLEKVAEVGGVAFYNDSKATNVDAASKALASFPGRRVWLILGGKDKGGDFGSLVSLLRERASGVLTIGQAAQTIERQIAGAVPVQRAGDLETAVRMAARLAAGHAGGATAGSSPGASAGSSAGTVSGSTAARIADSTAGKAAASTPEPNAGSAAGPATGAAAGTGSGVPVVLLAPACASFDQYRNYEERGEHFRRCVAKLAEAADA